MVQLVVVSSAVRRDEPSERCAQKRAGDKAKLERNRERMQTGLDGQRFIYQQSYLHAF